MESQADFGFVVHTYEVDANGSETPILSHVFWGHNLDQALALCQAHLKSDGFFSSSFIVEMIWGNDELFMNNYPNVISRRISVNSAEDADRLYDKINEEAKKIVTIQDELGLPKIINLTLKKSEK